MAERLVIRSYRRVFEVDRRIYRVDRWALPVPGGVPLRGLAYFAATVLLVVLLGPLPGIGDLAPPLRFVVLPLVVAVLGTQAAPDGRTAHRFAADWLRFRLRARRRCARRTVPLEGEPVAWTGRLAVRWDEHGADLHRARVRGPALVAFAEPVEFRERRRGLVARPSEDSPGPHTVVIGGGQMLEVRP